MKNSKKALWILIISALVLSACGPAATSSPAQPEQPAPAVAPLAPEVKPQIKADETPVETPEFKSPDGLKVVMLTPKAVPVETPPQLVQRFVKVDEQTLNLIGAIVTPKSKRTTEQQKLVDAVATSQDKRTQDQAATVAAAAGVMYSCDKVYPLVDSFLSMRMSQAIVDVVWLTGYAFEAGTAGYTLLASASKDGVVQVWFQAAEDATGFVVMTFATIDSAAMPGGIFGLAGGTDALSVYNYMASWGGTVLLTEAGSALLGNLETPMLLMRSDPEADFALIATLITLGTCLKRGADRFVEQHLDKLEKPSERFAVGGNKVTITLRQGDVQAFLDAFAEASKIAVAAGITALVACFASGYCMLTLPLLF